MLVGAWGLFLLVAPDAETARTSLQAEPAGPARANFVVASSDRFDLSSLLNDFQDQMTAQVQTNAMGPEPWRDGDAILVDGTTLATLIRQDRLRPIDQRQMQMAQRVGPQLQQWAASFDPQSSYGIPVFWEALGLQVAPDRMVSRIANPIAPNSMSVLFQPDIADDLMECGLAVQADASAGFAAALIYLGIDPASATPQQVEEAANLWELNSSVLQFEETAQDPGTPPCVRVGYYSGHGFLQGDMALALPREGTALKLYFLAIPKASAVPEQATAFIDYVLGAENLADVAKELKLNTTVLGEAGRHSEATERMLVAVNRAKLWTPAPDQQAGLKVRRWRLITSNAQAGGDVSP